MMGRRESWAESTGEVRVDATCAAVRTGNLRTSIDSCTTQNEVERRTGYREKAGRTMEAMTILRRAATLSDRPPGAAAALARRRRRLRLARRQPLGSTAGEGPA